VQVNRYIAGSSSGVPRVGQNWQGWIEAPDGSWVAFVRHRGETLVFLHRDMRTGRVVEAAPIRA